MKNKLKTFGFIATVLGFGATLLGNWVQEQQTKEAIKEEVKKELAEKGL